MTHALFTGPRPDGPKILRTGSGSMQLLRTIFGQVQVNKDALLTRQDTLDVLILVVKVRKPL